MADPGIIPAVRAAGSHPERDQMDPLGAAWPMRPAMSDGAPAGGFVVSRAVRRDLYPKPEPAPGSMPVRSYRECLRCGRRFPVYAMPGRPPRRCLEHRYGARIRGVQRVSRA